MSLIFHITPRSHWQRAQLSSVYQADSLSTERFIHCSTLDQVVRTANVFFAGERGLVLLCIEPDKVKSEIRYEDVGTSQFPHIYGPLNLNAVIQVVDFEPGSDGKFGLPQSFSH